MCPEYIQRDIVTLLPELVDDSLHEVRTRGPKYIYMYMYSAIPRLLAGLHAGALRAARRFRLTAPAF